MKRKKDARREENKKKNPTDKTYRGLSWMERGNSLYPFEIKPSMTILTTYSRLRKNKTMKPVSTTSFAKISLKTKITSTAVKR